MLVRRRLYHADSVGDLGEVRGDIEAIEQAQAEGTRMELVIRFASFVTVDSVKWVADQLNVRLPNVHPWPELDRIAFANDRALIIRWYKNPPWVALIIGVLLGLIVSMVILSVSLNRYEPVAQIVGGSAGLWFLVAGVVLVFVGPSLFRALDSRYQERLAWREVQLRALEALEGDRR